jgi:HSP20 family molecular chaperone IbpA
MKRVSKKPTNEFVGQPPVELRHKTVSWSSRGPVHLPELIDPQTVKAEYRNGLLRLTTSITAPVTKNIAVQAT